MREGDHRPAIDGLRAVAIVLVVAFHVGLPGFQGGFVGVDVFFVISGFLITGILVREQREGGIQLVHFWARRLRRLLPALVVMVASTMVAAVILLSPIEWSAVATDARAALLYISNLVFARREGGYFGSDTSQSYFLHTWSLAVEEQFYVLWPLVLILLGRACRGRTRPLVFALGAGSLLSLALGIVLTYRGTPWAFYSLPTRAWEFGAGGMLALRTTAVRPHRVGGVVTVVGLALIGLATIGFRPGDPYPGLRVIVPVIGTLAVLLGDRLGGGRIGRGLSSRPLTRVGLISYSWYLWHWPVMGLVQSSVGRSTTPLRSLAAIGALIPAVMSYRFIERPVRFGFLARRRPLLTYVTGILATVAAVTMSLGFGAIAQREVRNDPLLTEVAIAREDQVRLADSCPPVDRWGTCSFGDEASTTTGFLVGDSHAAQWLGPFDAAARALGVRLLYRSRGGCPAVEVRIAQLATRLVESPQCRRYREGTRMAMRESSPEFVVIANSSDYVGRILAPSGRLPSPTAQATLWRDGLRWERAFVESTGATLEYPMDGPVLGFDPNICIARHRAVEPCEPRREEATQRVRLLNDSARSALAGEQVVLLDVVDLMCEPTRCPLRVGDDLVFQDHGHVTSSYAMRRSAAFEDLLSELLPGRRRQGTTTK